MTLDDVIEHEIAHAAMAEVLGVPVTRISVESQGKSLGRCGHLPSNLAYDTLICMAPLAEARAIPDYPVAEPATQDEVDLAAIVRMSDMSERQWDALVRLTYQLAATRTYELACVTYRTALDRIGRSLPTEVTYWLSRLLDPED